MWIRFDEHLIHVTAINQRGPQFLVYIKDNLKVVLMWFPSAVTLARISAEFNFPHRKGDLYQPLVTLVLLIYRNTAVTFH